MRSASPLIALGALALLLLSGCADSTQRKNERAKLQAEREVASRESQRVTSPNPDVRVADVALLRDRSATAIVVDLRNRTSKPLTDVPIAVGVRGSKGRTRTLNERAGLNWFQTHVPAIPAGGGTTWVFRTRRSVPAHGTPFATVGVLAPPALSHAGTLPSIETVPQRSSGATNRTARVRVENASNVPQSGLQVYAVASAGGHYVAAGRAGVEQLAAGASTTVDVRLTGRPDGRPVRFVASPTIFE